MPMTAMNPVRRHASRGVAAASYDQLRTFKKVERKTLPQKALSALKEWGGAATLLIAVVYTFPSSIWDRVVANEDKQILQSRQALADGSSMVIERVLNTAKITDARALEMLNNMYNVKFYNLVYTNNHIVKKTAHRLKSTEITTFAGLLSFSGLISEALYYYDIGIQRAKEEGVPVANVLRDQAQNFLTPGPTQNVRRAIDAYRESLDYFANENNPFATRQFAIFLSELAYAEAMFGDWACGEKLGADARKALAVLNFSDPSLSDIVNWSNTNFSALKRKDGQAIDGCKYDVKSPTF